MKLHACMLAPLTLTILLTTTLPLAAQTTGKRTSLPADYPKVELFAGFTHFGTPLNDTVSGNRMVGLNGGSASLAFNFNRYIGLVGDFGGYDDSRLQLTGIGANQPFTVDSSGTAYTYLFGPRFSYRNSTRFTPFAQVLFGGVHASAVTVSGCNGSACTPLPSQNSFALTGGGGLDIRITRHFSIRAVQAEYMMTRFADVSDGVSTGSSSMQNDLRLSSGLLFGFGGAKPLPVQLACSVQPDSGFPGDPLTVTAAPENLNQKHPATYQWTVSGGTVTGSAPTATIGTTGIAPGTYVVTGHVTQGSHVSQQASCTANFTIQAFAPPTVSCSAAPSRLNLGDPATITAQAVSPQNRPITYSYSATAGTIVGNSSTATLSTAGSAPGPITVTCTAVDDQGKSASANVSLEVIAPTPPPAPLTNSLCAVSFERDHKRPERVDNEAKACLDDIALYMLREHDGRLVIVGNHEDNEKPAVATSRALNVRSYLVNEKGIDPSRLDLRLGTNNGRTVTNTFVPAGATYNSDGTTPVDAAAAPQNPAN
jgi:opacity protein-like surface antigen